MSLNIIHLVAVGGAQFGYIGLRALQTRVIVHSNKAFVLPLSLVIAVFEVFVIGSIAKIALGGDLAEMTGLALALGLGAGTGCLTAMRIHDRVLRNGNSR